MSRESRMLAGVLLITFPSVLFGGVSLLYMLTNDLAYSANELRQDLWRAGHATRACISCSRSCFCDTSMRSSRPPGNGHALAAPIAAIVVPVAFFCSVLSPTATAPNAIINLAYVGGAILAIGLLTLGVGLVRQPRL